MISRKPSFHLHYIIIVKSENNILAALLFFAFMLFVDAIGMKILSRYSIIFGCKITTFLKVDDYFFVQVCAELYNVCTDL